ncbi:DUF4916 domain-containing protein [Microbacterium oleivorans]|uniref:DUF4916 domain-containing protein n=1 Tax=Microbacterium TaxID=33882 RepID=UPI0028821AC3|nr:DUF4916 domain-containing protein [Microbacterium sp. ARD31]MDT0185745.1 DUF4916 domain-containing protein [Microbacterium sp. ARD31]
MTYLPDDVYALIEKSVPILCVDFFPFEVAPEGGERVGLILRHSPFGDVWCHLGGRVHRGESLRAAVDRHARDTLGVSVELPCDQPDYVYQWFPADIAPTDGTAHGDDPRKHSVGLTYLTRLAGVPTPRNEALDFRFFPVDALPSPMWPGSADLLERVLQAR